IQLRKPLLLMLGVVGVVLLVACANLAGLSLARGAGRQHELAIRAALGAGRWRLIRQSLAESLILGAMSCFVGVVFAVWARTVIASLMARAGDTLHYDLSLDFTVLCTGMVAALATATFSGLLPALRAGRVDPNDGLKPRGVLGAPRLRIGKVLVAGQICLSLLLMAGAGLYLRTVINLRNLDAGFNTSNLLVFQLNPGSAGFNASQLNAFYDQVQSSLMTIPGVQNAALVRNPLLDNQDWAGGFSFPKHASPPSGDLQTHRLVVGESYFATLGIPILQGRALSSTDKEGAVPALVVNESFARKYLPNENPIGQTVSFLKTDWQITGVCRDTKYANLKDPAPPTAYFSFRQFPLKYRTSFIVRSAVPPVTLSSSVRQAVAVINPAVPVVRIITQDQLRDGNISQERLFAILCGSLAGFAVLLSCVGLYGLMAYNVTRRMGEIGVRMALGALPWDVARSTLKEALALTAIGIGLGLPLVFAGSRLIKSQLYGIHPTDPVTLISVTSLLLFVALAAAWFPARRSALISPVDALRSE
ncbi:MAG: hypothetical protein JWN25_237, partial [Verrucomicrobiales bacterium]|nr:hypothetical protein [Verrucomicrobiales bacterium]